MKGGWSDGVVGIQCGLLFWGGIKNSFGKAAKKGGGAACSLSWRQRKGKDRRPARSRGALRGEKEEESDSGGWMDDAVGKGGGGRKKKKKKGFLGSLVSQARTRRKKGSVQSRKKKGVGDLHQSGEGKEGGRDLHPGGRGHGKRKRKGRFSYSYLP